MGCTRPLQRLYISISLDYRQNKAFVNRENFINIIMIDQLNN
jgi:hypothetical protein